MSAFIGRYSVCVLGVHLPVEVLATNSRAHAFEHAKTVDGSVVYDWSTGEQITE